jgi:hypothetical protein
MMAENKGFLSLIYRSLIRLYIMSNKIFCFFNHGKSEYDCKTAADIYNVALFFYARLAELFAG